MFKTFCDICQEEAVDSRIHLRFESDHRNKSLDFCGSDCLVKYLKNEGLAVSPGEGNPKNRGDMNGIACN